LLKIYVDYFMDYFLPKNFVLGNRFIVEKVIGQGGFGITYRVFDKKRSISRCVKELFVSGSSTRSADQTVFSMPIHGFSFGEMVMRFIQEAEMLSMFNHPNIVDVRGVFQENGTAYMVLEYVEGYSIGSCLKDGEIFSAQDCLFIIFEVLKALELVHENNLLHRDIKPDNILVTQEGRVVLIDFGSARQFSGMVSNHTAILSNGYAPLEQYSEISEKTTALDIYALGATMYHMLTGFRPIAAPQRLSSELDMPNKLNPTIDPVLSSIVMLCLELKPEDRLQSVPELANILKDYQKRYLR
jgi:serine/threonine protein kinase